MKTLIPVLLFMLLVGSCKKEDCYYCETTTYSKYDDRVIKSESEIVCFETDIERLKYMTDRYDFSQPDSYTGCECSAR